MARTLIFQTVEDAVHAFEWIDEHGNCIAPNQTLAKASISSNGRLATPGMRPKAWSLDVQDTSPVADLNIMIRS
ncbi:MAG: hypothetical protein ACLFV7_14720 [Phycisphaerae bacterium]